MKSKFHEVPVHGVVYGVVLNDEASLLAMGYQLDQPPYKAPPLAPVMYIKPANTLVGSCSTIQLPANEKVVDIGATLGMVMRRPVACFDGENLEEYVAGFVLVADLSLPHGSYYRPAIREKCFDGACPVAPAITPFSSLGRVEDIVIDVLVDGRRVYSRGLGDLHRDAAELLRDVSEFMTLVTGDMLLLGVPVQMLRVDVGSYVRLEADDMSAVEFFVEAEPEEQEGLAR